MHIVTIACQTWKNWTPPGLQIGPAGCFLPIYHSIQGCMHSIPSRPWMSDKDKLRTLGKSWANNSFIQPIVSYMNSKQNYLCCPVNFAPIWYDYIFFLFKPYLESISALRLEYKIHRGFERQLTTSNWRLTVFLFVQESHSTCFMCLGSCGTK